MCVCVCERMDNSRKTSLSSLDLRRKPNVRGKFCCDYISRDL